MAQSEQTPSKPKRVRNRKNKKAKLAAALPTKLSVKPKAKRLSQLDFDPKIFQTMNTGKIVDEFFSNKGGIPRACNFIGVGDPGVGKTTVFLDMLADAAENGAKVLFISGEMNEIDLYEYVERYPKFGDIDILFLADYADENPKLVIETMLNEGYDFVLGDSFVEIQDTVKETCFMTTSGSEKWLIDLMCEHNKGANKRKAYTTFIMIQQVTKGGVFVGSNKLKHNTTGMLEIRFSSQNDVTSPRYIEFTKNRRGNVLKRLYFNLNAPDHVDFNDKKWADDLKNEARIAGEVDALAKEASDFETLINSAPAPGENGEVKEEEKKEETQPAEESN